MAIALGRVVHRNSESLHTSVLAAVKQLFCTSTATHRNPVTSLADLINNMTLTYMTCYIYLRVTQSITYGIRLTEWCLFNIHASLSLSPLRLRVQCYFYLFIYFPLDITPYLLIPLAGK